MEAEGLNRALTMFGELLDAEGLEVELVVVGGAAMLLCRFSDRGTVDVDVVARVEDGRFRDPEPLPAALLEARDRVAAALGLPRDWLNTGPRSLLGELDHFPEDFLTQLTPLRFGGLTLLLPSRADLVLMKVDAAADHLVPHPSKHFEDLQSLAVDPGEFDQAAVALRAVNPSEGHLQEVEELRRRLFHG